MNAYNAIVRLKKSSTFLARLDESVEAGLDPTAAVAEVFKDLCLKKQEDIDECLSFLQQMGSRAEKGKDGLGLIGAMQAAEKAYHHRLKQLEASAAWLLSKIKEIMEAEPAIPYKGTLGEFRLQKNSAAALKLDLKLTDKTIYKCVDPTSETLVHPSLNPYIKPVTVYVVDTEKVKADLEAGMSFPWAKLERGSHVRTKL